MCHAPAALLALALFVGAAAVPTGSRAVYWQELDDRPGWWVVGPLLNSTPAHVEIQQFCEVHNVTKPACSQIMTAARGTESVLLRLDRIQHIRFSVDSIPRTIAVAGSTRRIEEVSGKSCEAHGLGEDHCGALTGRATSLHQSARACRGSSWLVDVDAFASEVRRHTDDLGCDRHVAGLPGTLGGEEDIEDSELHAFIRRMHAVGDLKTAACVALRVAAGEASRHSKSNSSKVFVLSHTLRLHHFLDGALALAMAAGARHNTTWPPSGEQQHLMQKSAELLDWIIERLPEASLIPLYASAVLHLHLLDHGRCSEMYLRAARAMENLEAHATIASCHRLDAGLLGFHLPDMHGHPRSRYSHSHPFKLRHDASQFRYLAQQQAAGMVVPTWPAEHWLSLAASYEAAAEAMVAASPDLSRPGTIVLSLDSLAVDESVRKNHGRLFHIRPTPALLGASPLGDWDGAELERRYKSRGRLGMAFQDDFLTPHALSELLAYCRESTVFHGIKGDIQGQGSAYLGAYMEFGFGPPLLFQIAAELRRRLPGLLGDHKLTQAWAYKYTDGMPAGINVHADNAAVNVNFWITPDDALEDSARDVDGGGLIIYDKEAPHDWDFDTMNRKPSEIYRFLRAQGEHAGPKARQAQSVSVAYRQNRMVMFHSNLFHETGRLRFKRGYKNNRINLTLLFGAREGPGPGGSASANTPQLQRRSATLDGA